MARPRVSCLLAGPALQSPKFPTSPFTLGVCSGDPSARRRRAVDAPRARSAERRRHAAQRRSRCSGRSPTDDKLSRVVKSGKTHRVARLGPHGPRGSHPGSSRTRWYWYQFRAGNELSPVGRTRTFPRAKSDVDRLRFAFASCQHFEAGLYTAYQHMAEEDLDLVMHLGDYIYESPGSDNLRPQARRRRADDAGRLPESLRAVPDRSGAAGRARLVPVSRRLGRSRSRQQLRRAVSGSRATRSSSSRCGAPPATRRTTSTCRCVAARFRKARCFSSTAPSRTGGSRAFRCSTRGSTAPISPARRHPVCALRGHHRSARHAAGCGAGAVADEPARPIAGGLEPSGPADSHREARSLRRARAPILDGQVGRLRRKPSAPAALPW